MSSVRQKRWLTNAVWIIAFWLLLVLGYLLSLGPVLRIEFSNAAPAWYSDFTIAYTRPVEWLYENYEAPGYELLVWYLELWGIPVGS